MSTRPFNEPHSVITSGDMSASIISQVTILKQKSGASYDISWTGSPTGTFSVEMSNTVVLNPDGSAAVAGNWTAVTLSAPITASGSPDNALINLAGLEANAIRLHYTRTSGSGTLNATLVAKVQ